MENPSARKTIDWPQASILFAAYIRGDEVATRALFSQLMPPIRGFYRARIRSGHADIEDLLQVVLLKIHFARDRYDMSQSLKTWVFTIASRTLIDHWRGSSNEREHLVDDEEDSLIDGLPSDLLSPEKKVELSENLNKALTTLKPIDRSIVYLYGVEGLSMAEIANTLDLTETATKIRAHRAYKELRTLLGVLAMWILAVLR